ncbi:LOW QUALITY PROTEIN: hypothetical protein ACHAXT_003185 [Thalassiosira profunda]
MSEEQPSLTDFPTAAAVPFPFESPYDVQKGLMAAILDALRQCQDKDDNGDGGDGSARRAPIIMLESPTGTGKSLSLACASMAWLKHCESADIDALLPLKEADATNSPRKPSAVSPSPTSLSNGKPKPKTYDWIEAWQPTDQEASDAPMASSVPPSSNATAEGNQTNSVPQPREQMRNYAVDNRAALDSELDGIRARLDRLVNVASFSAKEGQVTPANDREQVRTLRENLVRSGVASAMAKERKLNRQLGRSGEKGGGQHGKRRRTDGPKGEDEFLLEAYHSDEEARGDISSDSEDDDETALTALAKGKSPTAKSLTAKALLCGSNLDGSGYRNDPERNARSNNWENSTISNDAVGGVAAGSGLRKVVYAARTHSQLSQFISELKRTHWGKNVKVVALGSRSLLCSNEDVLYSSKSNKKNSRRSEAQITELCLDMQKNKGGAKRTKEGSEKGKRKNSCCPYLASSEATSTLALHSLVRPSDIEDMANLGKASHSCSYYASREALAAAEVVVLPYNTLLSPQARQSVGLSLQNALVVVDEAHNIPEALRSISSCQLSLPVAEAALSQLLAYTRKYAGRLAGRNVYYLGQIRRILLAMIKHLKRRPAASSSSNASDEPSDGSSPRKEMMAAVDLMFTLRLDNINLFSILRYLEKSRLSQKLLGFINYTAAANAGEQGTYDSAAPKEEGKEFMSKHVSSMSIVETFLARLTGTSREGKVIVEWPSEEELPGASTPTFRFVQIHSASQMDNVVEEAHAIVLAGGTLRPFTHVAAELFGDDANVMSSASTAEGQLSREYDIAGSPQSGASPVPSSLVQMTPRLTTFTCGHVIPPSNVVMACLSYGPTSQKLDFRHSSRSSNDMIDELGRTIMNLCSIVPKGFVVFLPSYKYESQVFQRWRSTGLLSQIDKKKPIHREPKNSRDLEAALARYSEQASTTNAGAVLFSVMGGKMSEGINFANDMARCVMVAGLPYPDITDPVLQEKMQSLDRECRNAGVGITGQAYYQNLCMRTVNQSVGRAIRHANDYAAIVLADFRYASDTRIWRGLPQWLRRGRGAPSPEDAKFGKVVKDPSLRGGQPLLPDLGPLLLRQPFIRIGLELLIGLTLFCGSQTGGPGVPLLVGRAQSVALAPKCGVALSFGAATAHRFVLITDENAACTTQVAQVKHAQSVGGGEI